MAQELDTRVLTRVRRDARGLQEAETWQGQPAVFDDRGGVLCGCPEATERCVAQSYALEPPPAIGGVE